jgi:hypothetical protein
MDGVLPTILSLRVAGKTACECTAKPARRDRCPHPRHRCHRDRTRHLKGRLGSHDDEANINGDVIGPSLDGPYPVGTNLIGANFDWANLDRDQ